jgi:hypothetical protein
MEDGMKTLGYLAASALLLAGSAAMAAPKSTVIIACYNKQRQKHTWLIKPRQKHGGAE